MDITQKFCQAKTAQAQKAKRVAGRVLGIFISCSKILSHGVCLEKILVIAVVAASNETIY
jgi:hypothetical protein